MTPSTYLIGFVIGFGLPLLSNIYPIRQALGTKLRDALDLSRQGIDETQVECVRKENKFLNLTQISISIVIFSISFLCLIVIPQNAATVEVLLCYFNTNLILIFSILGLVMTLEVL